MVSDSLKGIKILIVEDDYSSRFYLNKILEKAEATLVNAVNGQEAIDIAFNNPDIAVILMDLQLPIMDGYTSTRLIREFRENVIVIAQTACGLMGEREKIIEAGFNDYLIKPIFYDSLIEKLVYHLKKNGLL